MGPTSNLSAHGQGHFLVPPREARINDENVPPFPAGGEAFPGRDGTLHLERDPAIGQSSSSLAAPPQPTANVDVFGTRLANALAAPETMSFSAGPSTSSNARSIGQQRRRARERLAREQNHDKDMFEIVTPGTSHPHSPPSAESQAQQLPTPTSSAPLQRQRRGGREQRNATPGPSTIRWDPSGSDGPPNPTPRLRQLPTPSSGALAGSWQVIRGREQRNATPGPSTLQRNAQPQPWDVSGPESQPTSTHGASLAPLQDRQRRQQRNVTPGPSTICLNFVGSVGTREQALGLQTPPQMQTGRRPRTEANRRSIGQRARNEREQAARNADLGLQQQHHPDDRDPHIHEQQHVNGDQQEHDTEPEQYRRQESEGHEENRDHDAERHDCDVDQNHPWLNTNGLFCAARRPYVEPAARHDLGPMDIACTYCGALHWMSEKLVNSSLASPEFGFCCDHDQVRLPPLEEPPQPLRDLFVSDSAKSKEFRNNIWKYNRAFAFTSLGVREDHSVNRGNGPPVFRIQGELCHRSGSLAVAPGRPPVYAQLYIYEPRAALDHRIEQNQGLQPATLRLIQDVLLEHHPYAEIYRHAYEVLQGYNVEQDVAVRLRVAPGFDRGFDRCRYNLPTADEVAVILPDHQGENDRRDIHIYRRDGALRTISDLHPAYAPLQYVLLFPYGEPGWHPEMRLHQTDSNNEPRRLSLSRFVAYRMQVRRGQFSTLLRGGRLLQRYLVDMYACIDSQRLHFFYLQETQQMLRSCIASGIDDAIAAGDDDLNEIGQRFILPSSYIGGPRHMAQRFQDSMAIARHFRKVDIFLTITTNPHWAKIVRELLPGQTAYDRPDLVGRVFQLKKTTIIKYIYEKGVFGLAVAYVYAIEFQKRGLPHMHILIFLKEPYKLLTPEAIDSCIWARWPDPETEPLLFKTVKRCMVHGPCGVANPRAPCMENGKCTKGYPMEFQDYTTMNAHGYPLYFRPNDGRSYLVGNLWVDNRWIVPFSPYLSAIFDCHINVECAASIASFKYIFKYIQKGGDRASLQVDRRDEVTRYINGRYISASEAIHRTFHFDMHNQVPNIVRLQVHLPGQQWIVFRPNTSPKELRARAAAKRTKLMAFFEANADDALSEEARKYTYQEFPQRFTWKEAGKRWALRHRGFALGRMAYIPPTAGESFYLRTLLTVVKGPRLYRDLLTYNGVTHNTFHAACLARGLLEDDSEWRLCLQEASVMQTGTRLRHLFATILLFCHPSQPALLWNIYRDHICDDLPWRLRALGLPNPTNEEVYDYGLYLLEKVLNESGRSLAEFPMPQSERDWDAHIPNPLIAEQLNYDRVQERANLNVRLPQLNEDQASAYHRIIDSIENDLGKIFFVNGPGGTGKTFVYNTICCKVRSDGYIVLCVSSSGISALLIRGGRTSHSMFKIPVDDLNSESLCAIPKESQRAALLRMTKAIIWDEISAQHRYAPEALDRTCRDIRNDDRPFGGITVVFGGDFQQTLPVVLKGSREDIINATIQCSYLWTHVEVLHLHQNMRLDQSDPALQDFSKWLLDIGHGRINSHEGKVVIPGNMQANDVAHLIEFIYPDVNSLPPPPPEYFLNRMILAPRNSDVTDINDNLLQRMSGEGRTYFSADEVIREPGADGLDDLPMPVEFLRSVNASSLPPGELHLKPGCPVILLRNLSPSHGLCNGTRMIVTRMSDRVIEGQVMGGDFDGDVVLIPRISLMPTSKADFAFQLRRRQYPIRLAFALTINKSQGQSVKYVGIDLRMPVFGHGQLYVALSRATSPHRVKVLLPENESSSMNVVYPEVLLD